MWGYQQPFIQGAAFIYLKISKAYPTDQLRIKKRFSQLHAKEETFLLNWIGLNFLAKKAACIILTALNQNQI